MQYIVPISSIAERPDMSRENVATKLATINSGVEDASELIAYIGRLARPGGFTEQERNVIELYALAHASLAASVVNACTPEENERFRATVSAAISECSRRIQI